jgi:hypothetical protein
MAIRNLLARGLHGPSKELLVEGLALAELRRVIGELGPKITRRI